MKGEIDLTKSTEKESNVNPWRKPPEMAWKDFRQLLKEKKKHKAGEALQKQPLTQKVNKGGGKAVKGKTAVDASLAKAVVKGQVSSTNPAGRVLPDHLKKVEGNSPRTVGTKWHVGGKGRPPWAEHERGKAKAPPQAKSKN